MTQQTPCEQKTPELSSRAFSTIKIFTKKLFLNGWSLVQAGKQNDLKPGHLKDYKETYNDDKIFQEWEKEQKKSLPTISTSIKLMKFLIKKQLLKLISLAIMSLILNTIVFYRPVALENLLNIGSSSQQSSKLYSCILYYVLFELFYSFLQQAHILNRVQFNNRFLNSYRTLIYEKTLKLSSSSKKYLETGVLNSYYNQDCSIINQSINKIYKTLVCPFTVGVGTYRLYHQIGIFGLIAPLVILVTLFSQKFRTKKAKLLEKENSKLSDKKSKVINEYISGMKVLKYYGWEKIAQEKILSIRKEQEKLQNYIHKQYYIGGIFMNNIPNLYILFVFICFSLMDSSLTLTKFLVIQSIINILRSSFTELYWNLNDFTKIKISLTKIGNFLDSEEKKEENHEKQVEPGEIMMQGCIFKYENQRVREEENKRRLLTSELSQSQNKNKTQLLDLKQPIPKVLEVEELKIQSGELVGIVGKVGSGKSTLINGIIQQIQRSQGICQTNGRIAYCPQITWVKNDTIKENILFGLNYDQERYQDVIRRSQLEEDLKLLKNGDETIVGEKGIKLSGGQKQRISIARCLYSESEIYIFDDFLSALDAYIGKNIFFNAIKYLHGKKKTVVIVLNAIEYLKYCDQTIFVKDGSIENEKDLEKLKKKNSQFFESLTNEKKQQKKNPEENLKVKRQIELNESTEQNEKTVERQLKGQSQMSANQLLYKFIVENFSKKHTLLIVLIMGIQLVKIFYKWWLGYWTKNEDQSSLLFFIFGAFSIYLGEVLMEYVKSIELKSTGLQVGKKIHERYLETLFKTPMNWFDEKPVGQILDRAIKYQNRLDDQIIWALDWFTKIIVMFLIALIMVVEQTFINFFLIMAMFLIFYELTKRVDRPSRNIIDLMNETHEKRSSFLQETITGTNLIRSFGRQRNYKQSQVKRNRQYFTRRLNLHYLRGSFISLLMNVLSNIILASISFFILQNILMKSEPITENESLWVSLTLYSSIYIGGIFSQFFQCKLWLNEICVSLNKIYHWILTNPSEKPFLTPEPSEKWLKNGSVSIQKISYRYKPHFPIVLKDLCFEVKENQKIGIVGRTGSGKSTLTLGLLRILQICQNEDQSKGKILMDNTDISQIGLHHLRHTIAMIPQDPLLFSGTLKSNIDPFQKYTDEAIKNSLEKVHIWNDLKQDTSEKDPIKSKLNSRIDEEGSNYSLGQRQLICLARALIRNPKILLMDEATASIDLKTDKLIQEMIKTEFKDATVITIAHRLNTIIDYNKILVLDKGKIQQFDRPSTLVKNENSFLGKEIRKVSQEYAQRIMSLAK